MRTNTKYIDIYTQIKYDIESGKYPINEKLPQGRILAEQFNVSELTITKAINLLVQEGYIVRRRGSGTFVKDFSNSSITKFTPLSGTAALHDGDLTSTIIGFSAEVPTAFIAEKLGIDAETLVYKIIRLRTIKNIPSIIEYTWMPLEVIPNLTTKELQNSIYKYIHDELKLTIKSAHVKISGVRPTALEKAYLKITDNDFLLQQEQIAFLSDGRIFEFSIAKHIPSEFNFETVLIANEHG
ncbi:GntR family transcriptional regulator [Lactococcus hodotermopsidis]|uniref:GntR family transcriptional regulator n=1 Tax=Pseudolactococcus hodotermopsidis TaxID=2709157 RepID=A0A6A0BE84_9LACT|nr:GntR family transcriptional regulator [Lactococcus hodotermopsidis]GFH42661.1 GntR family transcriptional regulator [Lactococcus hodotermopsidis]